MAGFACVPPGAAWPQTHRTRRPTDTSCTGNNGYLRAWVKPQYSLQHLVLNDRQWSVPVNVQPYATKLLQWDTHQRGPVRASAAISTVMTTVHPIFPTVRCQKGRQLCQHHFLPDPLQTKHTLHKKNVGPYW